MATNPSGRAADTARGRVPAAHHQALGDSGSHPQDRTEAGLRNEEGK
jgi:hypothetical protein